MAKRCQCSSRCKHYARGSRLMLPDDRVLALESAIPILMDIADLFDQDGLEISPACDIHGPHPLPNGECSCIGPRYTAVEMVKALEVHVKAAGANLRDPVMTLRHVAGPKLTVRPNGH